VSRSNRSSSATREHASWAPPSTRLKLMDGDVQSEDLGKNKLGDPGLMAPKDLRDVATLPGTLL
jgi:hypothetical protein